MRLSRTEHGEINMDITNKRLKELDKEAESLLCAFHDLCAHVKKNIKIPQDDVYLKDNVNIDHLTEGKTKYEHKPV